MTRLGPRAQGVVHLALVIIALATLPIGLPESLQPTGGGAPTLGVIAVLAVAVGFPYLMLSTTGPLLQAWLSRSQRGSSPYRLYALSNVGSLLALLSYPFLFEPFIGLRHQA